MAVLVDTSVWSLAYRRHAANSDPAGTELANLVRQRQALLIGAVRQELLSGIRIGAQFEMLRRTLAAFPDLRLRQADYEEAARCFNRCRARGIQGSNTDFLICAAASRRNLSIFTTDRDFQSFQQVLGIRLHRIR